MDSAARLTPEQLVEQTTETIPRRRRAQGNAKQGQSKGNAKHATAARANNHTPAYFIMTGKAIQRKGVECTLEMAALLSQAYKDLGDDGWIPLELRWQHDVAMRYGWLGWASAVGLFWAVLALGLVWLVRLRRQRDRTRRALLDEGWAAPDDDVPSA